MKKILLANCHFQMNGGGDAVFHLEYEYLKKQGYDVYVCSCGDVEENKPSEGVFIYPAPRSNLERQIKKYCFDSSVRRYFKKVLARIEPDVVHLHLLNYPRAILSELSDYPTMLTMHGPNYFCANGWGVRRKDWSDCPWGIGWQCYENHCIKLSQLPLVYKRYRSLLNIINKRNILFHTPTKHLEKTLNRFGFANTRYIPLGIDPSFVSVPLDETPRKKQIVYAGALTESKGIRFLLEAFLETSKRCSDVTLKIAGRGDLLSYIKRWITERSLEKSIQLLGYVDHFKICELFRESAVFVMPSIWKEQFGLVGAEALACETPCVASNIGGIPEWLEDGKSGFLVPPRDSKSLADRISFLLENPCDARTMGKYGRQSVLKQYHPQNYLLSLERALLEIAK